MSLIMFYWLSLKARNFSLIALKKISKEYFLLMAAYIILIDYDSTRRVGMEFRAGEGRR